MSLRLINITMSPPGAFSSVFSSPARRGRGRGGLKRVLHQATNVFLVLAEDARSRATSWAVSHAEPPNNVFRSGANSGATERHAPQLRIGSAWTVRHHLGSHQCATALARHSGWR